ncbi:MarR family transcriptional regulator [Halobacteriales archaeon QH_7_66_36]|nr:MAG: MarR family transcriptional regulator [Halobacteriales archaeon QH_7_66_36]
MTDAADAEDPVELGVQLLERLEHESLPLPEVIDRIETVTTDAATQRQILETAERRGVIDRDAGTVRPNRSSFLSFEAEVVSKEGEFTCRRCDASISTGYFMRLGAGEHGPFGSTCIRKVTGRE